MSTTALPDVERWRSYATQASAKHGGIVPVPVILGLIHEESAGKEGQVSSADATGLTQFIPSTAASYHVNTTPGHAQSQIDGTVRYLLDLGYAQNPTLALAKYAAGPGNPQAGMYYARNVLSLSRLYAKPGQATPAPVQVPSSASAPATSSPGAGLFSGDQTSGMLYAVVWLGLVGGGVALAGIGLNGALGGAPARTARKVGKGAAAAAVIA